MENRNKLDYFKKPMATDLGKTIADKPDYRLYQKPKDIPDIEISGFKYGTFFITRANHHALWTILTLEGRKPPLPLQGIFTSLSIAKDQIDNFLKGEAILQELHEKKE
jgi:hypothetical protein